MELVFDHNTNIVNVEDNVFPALRYFICARLFIILQIFTLFLGGGGGSKRGKSLGVTPYRFINIY